VPTQIIKRPANIAADTWYVQQLSWTMKPGQGPFVRHVRAVMVQQNQNEPNNQQVVFASNPRLTRVHNTTTTLEVIIRDHEPEAIIDFGTQQTTSGQLRLETEQHLIDDVWPFEMYCAIAHGTSNGVCIVWVCWNPVPVGAIEGARLNMAQGWRIPRGGV